jgi:hypothetical protein
MVDQIFLGAEFIISMALISISPEIFKLSEVESTFSLHATKRRGDPAHRSLIDTAALLFADIMLIAVRRLYLGS